MNRFPLLKPTLLSLSIAVLSACGSDKVTSETSNTERSASVVADLGELSIADVHQAMANNTLNSEQLVHYYLDRINKLDKAGPELRSVAQVNPLALSRAKQLDNAYATTGLTGPLHGIPVLLKDNIDTGREDNQANSMANTAGSHALANNFPKDDAFLVRQLEQAGAIILGKANLSEWANFRSTSSSSGWSGLWGQVRNPYDPTTSPCGSSSGSGSSIAANLATLAVGTETDGSVVCPSALNGIVGIKPTLGTISRDGIIPISHSQDTAGPMARSVADAVTMLAVMAKFDPQDKQALKSTIDYLSHLKKDGLAGKRIGIARDLMGYHKGLDQVFEQAVFDLKEQGAIIVDELAFATSNQWGGPEFDVLLYEFKHDLNEYLASTGAEVPKSLAELIQFNKDRAAAEMPYFAQELFHMANEKGPLTEQAYIKALEDSKRLTREEGIDALLNQHDLDLIIAPTVGPAWKIDWVNGDHYLGAASSAAAISGYPHITVPMGYVHGLPVGLSLFSGKLQEGVLIEAAYGYEQATQHRKPPQL